MQHQITIRFKKLHPNAKIPIRSSKGAAGWDFFVIGEPDILYDTHHIPIFLFHTGLAIEIPPGFFLGIFPRSSLGKRGFTLSNCVGVIDEDYRGELMFPLRSSDPERTEYNWKELGDRLVQGILLPYTRMEFQEVDSLSQTERQTKGFGATGK